MLSAGSAGPAPLEQEYEPTTAAPSLARGDAARWLISAVSDDPDLAQRVALVVSELVSNAVEASNHPAAMLLEAAGPRVIVTVSNRSPRTQIPARDQWGPNNVLDSRGRGMTIVEALAESVTVDQRDDQVIVSASLTARPPPA